MRGFTFVGDLPQTIAVETAPTPKWYRSILSVGGVLTPTIYIGEFTSVDNLLQ